MATKHILACILSVLLLLFTSVVSQFEDTVGVPPFKIDQKSLLKYLGLQSININLPALYVFGDSFNDPGNNNFLDVKVHLNYLPFGVDFDGGKATGRPTNGRLVVDFLAQVVGLPFPPAFLSLSSWQRTNTSTGINYASTPAGILPSTGKVVGNILSMEEQIDIFENATLPDLKAQFKGNDRLLSDHLSRSLFFVHVGSNDLGPAYEIGPYKNISFPQYTNIILDTFSKQLKRLYELGARKILVHNSYPVGCEPYILHSFNTTTGCYSPLNKRIDNYNNLLSDLLTKLRAALQGSRFTAANLYRIFDEAFHNPAPYGFKDVRDSCCTVNDWTDAPFCIKDSKPCANRNEYVFFDAFHPTESFNFLWLKRLLKQPSVCKPETLTQLLQA